MPDWILPAGATAITAGGLLIASLRFQRGVLEGKRKRDMAAAVEKQRLDDLRDWAERHERSDDADRARIEQHQVEIRVLKENCLEIRTAHKLIFGKLEELAVGIAEIKNGGRTG